MSKKHIVITVVTTVAILVLMVGIVTGSNKTRNIESYYEITPGMSLEKTAYITEDNELIINLIGFVAFYNTDQKIKDNQYFRIINTKRYDEDYNYIYELERFVDGGVFGDIRILDRSDLFLTEKNKSEFILSNNNGYNFSFNRSLLGNKQALYSERLGRQVAYENILNVTAEDGTGTGFKLITDLNDYQNFVWENIYNEDPMEK